MVASPVQLAPLEQSAWLQMARSPMDDSPEKLTLLQMTNPNSDRHPMAGSLVQFGWLEMARKSMADTPEQSG